MEIKNNTLPENLNNSNYWMESGKVGDIRSFLESISSESIRSAYYVRRDKRGAPKQVVYLGSVSVAPRVIGQFIDDCFGSNTNPFLIPRVRERQLEGGRIYDISLSEGQKNDFSHKLRLVLRG